MWRGLEAVVENDILYVQKTALYKILHQTTLITESDISELRISHWEFDFLVIQVEHVNWIKRRHILRQSRGKSKYFNTKTEKLKGWRRVKRVEFGKFWRMRERERVGGRWKWRDREERREKGISDLEEFKGLKGRRRAGSWSNSAEVDVWTIQTRGRGRFEAWTIWGRRKWSGVETRRNPGEWGDRKNLKVSEMERCDLKNWRRTIKAGGSWLVENFRGGENYLDFGFKKI